MGNKCGQSSRQEITTPQNPQQEQIALRYAPIMGLDHPQNINNLYCEFQKMIPNQTLGTGIKKTQAYKSLITKEELQKKRCEFWETRTTGQLECWQALRCACEQEEEEACSLLQAIGIKLVNKSLQMVYDEQGNKYEIPIFCINDPIVQDLLPQQKSAQINFIKQQITIKIRSTKTNSDMPFTVSNSIMISELKKMYLTSLKLSNHKMRLILNGKEMNDNNPLGQYNVQNDQILQAFISDLK